MDRKTALDIIMSRASKKAGKEAYVPPSTKGRGVRPSGGVSPSDHAEECVIEAIERMDLSREFLRTVQEALEGRLDPKDVVAATTLPAIVTLMTEMTKGDSRVRVSAADSLLDRAGISRIQKVQSTQTRLTLSASEAELKSAILGKIHATGVAKVIDTTAEDMDDEEFDDVEFED